MSSNVVKRQSDKLVKDCYNVSNLEMAVLLMHLHAANYMPEEVGFEDANRTIESLTASCNRTKTQIYKDSLESALWSANLLDELGLFWHPQGDSFQAFVDRIIKRHLPKHLKKGVHYDRFYNLILSKGDK